MSTIRVKKSKDFTVMSNYHLRDRGLTLRAKGLLSLMLSLPDEWNYSISGLASISVESETAIKTTLNELKKYGYLIVTKLPPNKTESGRFEYIYDVYETPRLARGEKQGVEKQPLEVLPLEVLPVENHPLNKSTYKSNTDNQVLTIDNEEIESASTAAPAPAKPVKHKHGEYRNVLLTDDELNALAQQFPGDWMQRIERLSEYIASTGKKYKSHYATIRSWAKRDTQKNSKDERSTNVFQQIFEEERMRSGHE